MIRAFDAHELDELVTELVRPGAVAELAILAGCLAAAWIVVRLLRGVLDEYGADPEGSALVPFAEPGACRIVVPPVDDLS